MQMLAPLLPCPLCTYQPHHNPRWASLALALKESLLAGVLGLPENGGGHGPHLISCRCRYSKLLALAGLTCDSPRVLRMVISCLWRQRGPGLWEVQWPAEGSRFPGLGRGSLGLSGSSQPEAHVQSLQLTVEERYKHCSESKVKTKPEMVMHTCNPNTWQSEAGKQQVQSQPVLLVHTSFKAKAALA